jgi:hypothetical protein
LERQELVNHDLKLMLKHIADNMAEVGDDQILALVDGLHELLRSRRREIASSVKQYAVLQSGDEWQIVCQRGRMGHFKTRDLARTAGLRLAREAFVAGHQVEFLVQTPSGELMKHDFLSWVATPAAE